MSRMKRLLSSEIFDIDWRDLDVVIALARKAGEGQVVVKYHDRPNYNITHLKRAMQLVRDGQARVVFAT